MTASTDKRRHPRFELTLPVKYQLFGADGGDHGCGISRSLDVSKGGLKLVGSANAVPGDGISITVHSGADGITLKGRVCWVHQLAYRQCEIGVSFDEIQADEEERLYRLLEGLST
ncbi:MAG TPA: PilZ domain-containing protein [Spirochaetota bacterium]|nr:PilZ domain-containing protein [Spirochaetota bacterium]HPH01486.1 PilZ domain-containing protein [Spirochaetota bacterium]HPN82399.1 PilZ domain-containing protein [Spirochaetota bacterium]